jgi:hypothetical protein
MHGIEKGLPTLLESVCSLDLEKVKGDIYPPQFLTGLRIFFILK